VTVEAVSDHSRRHPTYYAAVGLPSLVAPGTWSVYGMRVISALLFAALITGLPPMWRRYILGRSGSSWASLQASHRWRCRLREE